MPVPRMTTRRWMIAVAVVALLFEAELTRQAWLERTAHARWYATAERRAQDVVRRVQAEIARGRNDLGQVARTHERVATRYGQLRRHWERAARRPWLPETPEPPTN